MKKKSLAFGAELPCPHFENFLFFIQEFFHFYNSSMPFLFSLFFTILALCFGQNLSLNPSEQQPVEVIKLDAEWACGTDSFSRFLAESTVEKDCPEKKNAINNCCVAHDNCYGDQKGLKNCDDTFCNCLEIASTGSEVCSREDAPYFCQLVRQFGEQFYNESAKSITDKMRIGPFGPVAPIVPAKVNNGQQRKKRRMRLRN